MAFLWLWRSGNAARLRDLLRRRLRSPWLHRGAFGAALGALATLASLPFAFAWYRITLTVGLTAQPVSAWFLGELTRLGVVALCTAAVVALVLALVDCTRLWYLAFIGILYAVTLAIVAVEPVLFSPLTTSDAPASAGIVAVGDQVASALATAPVPLSIAGSAGHPSTLLSRTSGLGPFARIQIGNRALAALTPGELRFLLARQYAHVRQHDVLVLTLAGITLSIFAAALAVLVSDRIGFRRDDDALSRLALVFTFLGVFALLLYPAYNAIQRGIEWNTDRIAMAAVGDPASGVRFFVRLADVDLVALCGRRSVRWYFEGRPRVGSRIAAINHTADPCPP